MAGVAESFSGLTYEALHGVEPDTCEISGGGISRGSSMKPEDGVIKVASVEVPKDVLHGDWRRMDNDNTEGSFTDGSQADSSLSSPTEASEWSRVHNVWDVPQPFPLASFFDYRPCGDGSSNDGDDSLSPRWSSGESSDDEEVFSPVSQQLPLVCRHEGQDVGKSEENSEDLGAVCGVASPFLAANEIAEITVEEDFSRLNTVDKEEGVVGEDVIQTGREGQQLVDEHEFDEATFNTFNFDELSGLASDEGAGDCEDDVIDEDGWEGVEDAVGEDGQGELRAEVEMTDMTHEEDLFITTLLVGNLLHLAEQHDLRGESRTQSGESMRSIRRRLGSSTEARIRSTGMWIQPPKVGGIAWIPSKEPTVGTRSPAGAVNKVGDDIRTLLWDKNFVHSLFETLPGVDPSNSYLQATLKDLRGAEPPVPLL